MVDKPCPLYQHGTPGPLERWMRRVILGEPNRLKCETCGGHHVLPQDKEKGA